MEDYYEPPEPKVDELTRVVCVNEECWMHDAREEWNPEVFTEYQGVYPHGGPVEHYTIDAFTCSECSCEGEEVRS